MILNYIYLALFALFSYHPLHISVTNLEIELDKHMMHLHSSINSEDLLHQLKHKYSLNEKDDADSLLMYEKYIIHYFKQKFLLSVNDETLSFKITSIDMVSSNCIIKATFEVPKKEINTIRFQNTILLDLFFDQKNLIIVSLNNQETGYECNYNEREIIINP